jgi:hypothetical protein
MPAFPEITTVGRSRVENHRAQQKYNFSIHKMLQRYEILLNNKTQLVTSVNMQTNLKIP